MASEIYYPCTRVYYELFSKPELSLNLSTPKPVEREDPQTIETQYSIPCDHPVEWINSLSLLLSLLLSSSPSLLFRSAEQNERKKKHELSCRSTGSPPCGTAAGRDNNVSKPRYLIVGSLTHIWCDHI